MPAIKARVVHISTPLSWRGGEQQLTYLVGELQQSPLEQFLFCAAGGAVEKYCKEQGWTYQSFKKRGAVNFSAARQLAKICKSDLPTIVHVHDSHGHTMAAIAASFFGNKAPIIVSRRVDFPVKNNFLSKWKYNHPRIAKIICVSDFIRKITAPSIKDKNKLEVVHSGVDPSRFTHKASGILRRAYQIPKDTFLIANVAAIAPHKDYFTFVDTAAKILQHRKDVHFLIIGGDGGEQSQIETYIQDNDLEKEITLTGFRKDIPHILPEIDILLFTSKTEGLGTSLIDTFLCKVPVVATAAGGVPELVEDQVSGLLAPIQDSTTLADKVLQILADKKLAQQLISQAYKKAQDFSKQKTAQQTLYWYRHVLGKTETDYA